MMLSNGLVFQTLSGQNYVNIVAQTEQGVFLYQDVKVDVVNGRAYVDLNAHTFPSPEVCKNYLHAMRRLKQEDRELLTLFDIQYDLGSHVVTKTGEPLVRAWQIQPAQPRRTRRRLRETVAALS
ncbi:MAG: hypothetical protein AB7G06_09025 [Bdellovibrionales bacterium]